MLANGQNLTNLPSTADGSTTLFREDQERFLQCSPPAQLHRPTPKTNPTTDLQRPLPAQRRGQELLLQCSPPHAQPTAALVCLGGTRNCYSNAAPPAQLYIGLPSRAATSAFRSPLPTYSGPRPNPGHIAEGRTSLLRRDQERLLHAAPPAQLHRPTLIQLGIRCAQQGGSCQAGRDWPLTSVH